MHDNQKACTRTCPWSVRPLEALQGKMWRRLELSPSASSLAAWGHSGANCSIFCGLSAEKAPKTSQNLSCCTVMGWCISFSHSQPTEGGQRGPVGKSQVYSPASHRRLSADVLGSLTRTTLATSLHWSSEGYKLPPATCWSTWASLLQSLTCQEWNLFSRTLCCQSSLLWRCNPPYSSPPPRCGSWRVSVASRPGANLLPAPLP